MASRNVRILLLALMAASPLAATVQAEAATLDGRDRNTIIQQRRWNDLNALDSLESRERFQQQQQQYREQDRQSIQRKLQQPRPKIQEFRPSGCPEQVFGSKSFRNCR